MASQNTKRRATFESTSEHAKIGDKRPKQPATGSSRVQRDTRSSETPQRFTWPENPAELMNKIPGLTRNARARAKKRLKARLEELGYVEPPPAHQIFVLEEKHWLQSYAARLEFSKKQLEVKENELARCSSREEFDNAKECIRSMKKRVANEVLPNLLKERDRCEKEQVQSAGEQLLGLLNEFDVLIRDYEKFGVSGSAGHYYVQPTADLEPRENPRCAAASSVACSSPKESSIGPARTPSDRIARASPKPKRVTSPRVHAPAVTISSSSTSAKKSTSNAGHLPEAPQDEVTETGIYSNSIFEESLDENDTAAWLHFT